MTNRPFQHDVGAFLAVNAALNPVVATSTASGVEINGTAIDRQAFTHDMPLSGKVIAEGYAALTATDTATLAFNVQHADSSTGAWTDYNDKDGNLTVTNILGTTLTTAANTDIGVTAGDYDFGSAKRWLRVQVTPTLTNTTGADTLDYGGVIVFGGFNFDPAA